MLCCSGVLSYLHLLIFSLTNLSPKVNNFFGFGGTKSTIGFGITHLGIIFSVWARQQFFKYRTFLVLGRR
jgi:hypothetical protein